MRMERCLGRSCRPLLIPAVGLDEQFPPYVFGDLLDFSGHPRLQPQFPLQRRPQRKQQITGGRGLDQIAHPLRPDTRREICQGHQHLPWQHVQFGQDQQRRLNISGTCFVIASREVRPSPDQMALQSAVRHSRSPRQKRTLEQSEGGPCPAFGQFMLCPPAQRRLRRVAKRRLIARFEAPDDFVPRRERLLSSVQTGQERGLADESLRDGLDTVGLVAAPEPPECLVTGLKRLIRSIQRAQHHHPVEDSRRDLFVIQGRATLPEPAHDVVPYPDRVLRPVHMDQRRAFADQRRGEVLRNSRLVTVSETAFDLVPDGQRLLVPVRSNEHDALVDENPCNRFDNCRHVTFTEAIDRPVAGCERLFRPTQLEQIGAPVLEGAGDQRDPLRQVAGPETVFDLLPNRERLFVSAQLFQQSTPVRLGLRDRGEEFGRSSAPKHSPHPPTIAALPQTFPHCAAPQPCSSARYNTVLPRPANRPPRST